MSAIFGCVLWGLDTGVEIKNRAKSCYSNRVARVFQVKIDGFQNAYAFY